ncbi:hypothetical protein [Desulfitobacterium hafniense]|uniref:hypothetical protein n=1 Tax=Desulfitobacterium hafniense TaxID=49338 RepID=UPI00035C4CAC|nr:hypothetical protein [Desulfitobacterium hafniense]
MEMKAYHAGIRGIVKVGSKYITFTDNSGTFKKAEIMRNENGQFSIYGSMKSVEHMNKNEAVALWLQKAGYKLLTDEFSQIWGSDYIAKKAKSITKAVEDGDFESAVEDLQMIKEKIRSAEFFLKRKIIRTYEGIHPPD